MSRMKIPAAIERISSAEEPLAVFLDDRGDERFVDVRFANTVSTQRRIREADPGLVGVFSSHNARVAVERMLERAGRSGRTRVGYRTPMAGATA